MDKAIVYLEQRVRRFPGGPDMSDENIKKNVVAAMVKFGRDCATAALKAASEKVSLTEFAAEFLQEGASEAIDKNSILSAYNINEIQ